MCNSSRCPNEIQPTSVSDDKLMQRAVLLYMSM
jgi:hypothetical protein